MAVHFQTAEPAAGGPAIEPVDEDRAFLRRRERPAAPPTTADVTIVDLFCGCGGLTIGAIEGARRAGRSARLTLAVDLDRGALDVLGRTLKSHDAQLRAVDLSQLLGRIAEPTLETERQLLGLLGPTSLLLAGPPCQGHSALNNHTRHDDPRNDLYLAVARVARLLEPGAICIENVGGISSDRRQTVDRCAAALAELGYDTTSRRLDLHGLGVPQNRVRHVLIATRDRRFEWSLPSRPARAVRWAVEDLLDSEDVEDATGFDTPSRPSAENRQRIEWLFEHGQYNLPNEKRPECHQTAHSYRSMYGRLRWDAPAQTITSGFGSMGQGRYVHPLRRRTITAHEAARLQCLPDFVALAEGPLTRSARATMIGNAAPPLLTAILVQALVHQALV